MKKSLSKKELITAFDLEFNQPSGKIISIGAVIGNLYTGKIIDEFHKYVKINEKLCTNSLYINIPKLTGITDELLEAQGISLIEAYSKLVEFHKQAHFRNPVVWGCGDMQALKDQLYAAGIRFSEGFENRDKLPFFCFGHRKFDAKQRFQEQCILEKAKIQSGLKKSINRCGLQFKGRPHEAVSDARNTFLFYKYLLFDHKFGKIRETKNRRSYEKKQFKCYTDGGV